MHVHETVVQEIILITRQGICVSILCMTTWYDEENELGINDVVLRVA